MQTNGRSYGPISGLPGEYAYPTAYARAGIDYPAHGQSHSRSERGEREERSGGVDREGGRGDSGGYHWNVEDDRYQSGFERADYDYLDMERRGRDQGDRADEGGRHDPTPTYTHAGPAQEKHSEGGSNREYRAPASQPFNPKQPLRRNAACRSCRRRKLKCNAGRPHCSACLRSHAHAVRTGQQLHPVLDCQYDLAEEEGEGDAGGGPVRLLSADGKRPALVASPESGSGGNGGGRMPSKKRRASSAANGGGPGGEDMSDEAVLQRLAQNNEPQTLQRYINMLQTTLASKSPPGLQGSVHSDSTSGQSGTSLGANGAAGYGILPAKTWAVTPLQPYAPGPRPADVPRDQSLLNLLSATAAAAAIENQEHSSTEASPAAHSASTGRSACIQRINEAQVEHDSAQAFLQDVFYPGWPRDLPDPTMMDQLLETFFGIVPILPHILQRARFLSSMTLPPLHHNFPFVGLLHAICAAVPRYYGGDIFVEPVTCNWDSMPKPEDPRTVRDFGRRHEAFARQAIDRSISEGKHLFACAQALAVLMHHYYTEARWLDGWMAHGMLCRILVPLGVMKSLDPALLGPPGKMTLLPPPKDDVERSERQNLVWIAAVYDISMESSSGWPGALNMDEILIPLPAGTAQFDAGGYIPKNPQDGQSCDIFMHHPVADGFSLYMKCILLLRKINRFVRNLDTKTDGLAGVRESTAFKDLDAQIGTFILTFPPSLRDPLGPSPSKFRKSMDHDLFTAQLLLHHQAVKLHEPFVDYRNINDPSTRRVLAGSRGILKLIYLLSATTYDIRLVLHGEFALLTATRVLISFLEVEMETQSGAAGTKETLEAEIEVFRCLFVARGQKFPIGLRQSRMVEGLLERAKNGTATPGYACVHKRPEPVCAMGVTVVS